MLKRIAFVTYETPFAPCGGIAAVMAHLPIAFQEESKMPVTVITPFHYKIENTIKAEGDTKLIGETMVTYAHQILRFQILKLIDRIEWVFIKCLDNPEGERPLFSGARHPYDLSQDRIENSQMLLRDALIFGTGVINSLPLLDPHASWIFFLQDWEAAPTAFAARGSSLKLSAYLILHNSYDSYAPDEIIEKAGIDPSTVPGTTILKRAIPVVDKPVFTVSNQFAIDLVEEEVIQSKVMAPHLVSDLKSVLVGVNNAVFTDLSIPKNVLDQAGMGDFSLLSTWKREQREKAFTALDKAIETSEKTVWGDPRRFLREDCPWFILAGRDDSRQKGYDVACKAIEEALEEGLEACFIFFPIPGDEGLPGLRFLEKLANTFPERVLVLPFIFREGYLSVVQGAAFGVIPSFYEPFGMVNEFYLKGTVGIGRATGGILQQIVPYRNVKCFNEYVKRRADRWFTEHTPPTGFLFREPDDLPDVVSEWEVINAANYSLSGSPDRVEQRSSLRVFKAMTAELKSCLFETTDIYTNNQQLYFRLLFNGVTYISRSFSWQLTARIYNGFIN